LPYHRTARAATRRLRRTPTHVSHAPDHHRHRNHGARPAAGHRIIELAALEVANRRATGRTVHFRIDPEREIDAAATEVHGMTWEDLKGKPKFREIAAEFIAFAQGAEWIIHNAPFDLRSSTSS
jgi:DNA polymerase III epsilon subunit family exonuclease